MNRAAGNNLVLLGMSALCALMLATLFAAPASAHTVDEPLTGGGQAGTHTIHMDAGGFSPERLEINQGDTVIFENVDERDRWPASNIHPTHTVYPGSDIAKCGTDEEEGLFDACRGLMSGEEYAFTFDQAGRWRFHDHLWPQLAGEIVVHAVEGFEGEVHDENSSENAQENTGERRSISGRIDGWIKGIAQGLANFLNKIFTKPPEPVDLSSVSIVAIADDDETLAEVIRSAGPEEVMTRLLEETGGGSTIDCHQEAHQVGRLSYEEFGASVFEKGDASCHSGYYHGAMEAFLAERGTENLATNIHELCNIFDTTFGIFECLHGVGHGVMAYENYDMPAALNGCDDLGDDFSARSCYGGVYMENVVAGQGLGALPGHETEWVSDTDMHFPCNSSAMQGDYERRYECYQMQTSWMLTLARYDFPTVAAECEKAPADMVGVCYKSFGRDAAGHTLRDPEQIITICSQVPNESGYYDQCVEGAVNVIIDFWGPKLERQAHEFCEQVPNESSKDRCLSIVEGRLPQLFGNR